MLACLFAGLARAAAGEEGGVLSENSFLDELPVVLSATRLRQPLRDTPAAVTLIDREMIRDAGARDVADLFRLVPGMYVAYNVDKEIVPGHVVSYHGLADPYAKRMQVQIDGRSVYTPLFGGPVWSSIPLVLDDIERIEVVRGPSAATYGANAFLGVINIVTRDPAEVRGRMLALSAGDAGGDAILRHGGRTDNADYRITLQLRRDKGYTDDAQGSYGGRPVFPRSDDKSIGNLAFRGDYRLTPQDELQVQFGYAGGTREAGDIPNNNPRREKDAASQYGLLRWQRALGPESQLALRVYHNRDRFAEDSSALIGNTAFVLPSGLPVLLGVPAPLDQPLRHVAERSDVEAQHSFAPDETLRIVWGGGFRRDAVSSALYLGAGGFRVFTQRNLFANAEWRPGARWLFNLGAMVENNSFVGTRASPRLAVNHRLGARQTLRASIGRAYRNPVVYEQHGNSRWLYPVLAPSGPGLPGVLPLQYLLAPGDLRPERIDSHELGYLLDLGRGSALDLKIADDRLSDLIEMQGVPCPGGPPALCALTTPGTVVRSFANRGSVRVSTVEVQWQQALGERTRIHLGLASTRLRNRGGVPPGAPDYPRTAPRHALNLLLAHQLAPQWRGSVAAYRSSASRAVSGDALPGGTRWDLRLARSFRWEGMAGGAGAGAGEFALVVQNVGDTGIREFYADNLLGRRILASLRLEF